MLAENWTYAVVETDRGMEMSVANKVDPTKVKTFFLAAHGEQVRLRLCSHMESLTDDQCQGYFPAERKKKDKQAT